MAITALPNPPSRSDPANFSERADAFMAALPAFAQEANSLQDDVTTKQAASADSAEAAAASQGNAANSKTAAQQAAAAANDAAQTAAQKATAAAGSEKLAKDWANKVGAPIDGVEFSAKHYAQQAAAGAGLPVVVEGNVPSVNSGPVFIVDHGIAQWDEAQGRYVVLSEIPVGSPSWWPKRSSIPPGQIPLDGQTVSRALFPDLAALVTAAGITAVPVVSEALWLSDPTLRGAYTAGDGVTTIRLPDFNGKSADSLGAVVRRGDGVLSAETNGVIQRDAMQVITGAQNMAYGVVTGAGTGVFSGSRQQDGPARSRSGYADSGASDNIRFDNTGVVRTASENRALNVTGVWTVHAFGAVTNPGSVDAAQLASDYAVLNAGVQSLDAALDFAIIYPGGGNAAAPGTVAVNTRYITPNPFPGHHVMVDVQIQLVGGSGDWGNPNWIYTNVDGGIGVRSAQLNGGSIVTQTGASYLCTSTGANGGSPFGNVAAVTTPRPCRVLVRKLKGAV